MNNKKVSAHCWWTVGAMGIAALFIAIVTIMATQ
jgi:hypothetical protein